MRGLPLPADQSPYIHQLSTVCAYGLLLFLAVPTGLEDGVTIVVSVIAGMVCQRALGSQALMAPLHILILPQLTARDLSFLSCTCRDLRAAVASAPASSWQAAAVAALPQPTLDPKACWSEVQVLLNRYAQAKRTTRGSKGHRRTRLDRKDVPGQSTPIFSPDGALICVVTHASLTAPIRQEFGLPLLEKVTTVAMHRVHTGVAFRLLLHGQPSSCAFTHDCQQLILADAELEQVRNVQELGCKEMTRGKAVRAVWQTLAIEGDNLALSGSAEFHIVADTENITQHLSTSLAPGGRFLAVESFVHCFSRAVFLIDLTSQALALMSPLFSVHLLAWHAKGFKVAVLKRSGVLEVMNLASGQVVHFGESNKFIEASWRGDALLGVDILGTMTLLFDPLSATAGAVHLRTSPSPTSISPYCARAIDIPYGAGALPVVTVLASGQQLCTLASRPAVAANLDKRCFWSCDALFLACKSSSCTSPDTCTFYDTGSGGIVLPQLRGLKVQDVLWAPDCCSIALTVESDTFEQEVHLVRLAPGPALQEPRWCASELCSQRVAARRRSFCGFMSAALMVLSVPLLCGL